MVEIDFFHFFQGKIYSFPGLDPKPQYSFSTSLTQVQYHFKILYIIQVPYPN